VAAATTFGHRHFLTTVEGIMLKYQATGAKYAAIIAIRAILATNLI
jgi:hypothetical protein